jgi:molybdenum-dependent DNA-binding transcriptional regulator ModE
MPKHVGVELKLIHKKIHYFLENLLVFLQTIQSPVRENRDGEKGTCARLKDRGKKFLQNFDNTFQGRKLQQSQNRRNFKQDS